jgi:hypothetical protein
MLAKAIEEEAKLSQELIKEGFSHAFKAGELIEEVSNLLNSEEKLQVWLKRQLFKNRASNLNNCRKLFKGKL